MKTARKSLVWILAVMAMVSVMLFASFTFKPVSANVADVQGITVQEKASARIGAEPYGLRFQIDLTAEAVERVLSADKQLGALIIPYSYVEDYKESESTDGYHKWLIDNKDGKMVDLCYNEEEWVKVDDNTGAGVALVAITDIKFNNIARDFVAIPYVLDLTAETYAYAEVSANNAKNIADVVFAELMTNDGSLTSEQMSYLSNIYLNGMYVKQGVTMNAEGQYVYNDAVVANLFDVVLDADCDLGYAKNGDTVEFNVEDVEVGFTGYSEDVIVKYGDTELTATNDNGAVSVTLSGLASGAQKLTVGIPLSQDICMWFNINLTVYTHVISSVNDLNAMGATGYYILSGNINCAGTNVLEHANFNGTLDGCGFTVYNANMTNRLFTMINGATIKNIGFVNFTRNGGGGGVLVCDASGTNLYENVFLLGNHNGYSTSLGGLFNVSTDLTVRNTVSYVEFQYMQSVCPDGGVIMAGSSAEHMENNYFVSSTSNGVLYANGPAVEGTNALYTTQSAFNSAVAGWTVTDDAIGAFSTDMWTVYNGTLMFKSSVDVVKDLINSTLINNAEQTLISGGSITLKGASIMGNSVFALKEPVAGVTLENGVLKADATVAEGSVTIVATHSLFTDLSKEYTVTLVPATKVDLAEVEYFMEKGNFSYDFASYNLTSIISVEIDGNAIDGYTFENNSLTIPVAKFSGNHQKVTVLAGSNNGIYSFNIPVYAINYLIETAQEYRSMGTLLNATGSKGKVFALGNNIDLAGTGVLYSMATYFNATLDGRGYTVSNAVFGNRQFTYSVCGTFKNIAYINTSYTGYGGVFFAEMYKDGSVPYGYDVTIENVFIHFSSLDNSGSSGALSLGLGTNANEAHISNVVIVIDNALTSPNNGVLAKNKKAMLDNVYVVSSNATKLLSDSTDSTGIYATQSAFNNAVAGWTVTDDAIGTFSKDMWTVTDSGMLVMDSVFDVEQVNITNADTSLLSGTSIKLEADKSVTWSLQESVDGVSIENGYIKADNSIVAGNVTVVATYTKTIFGVTNTSTDTLTFTLVPVTTVNLDDVIYETTTMTDGVSIDLSQYEIASFDSITLNGSAFTDYTYENGIIAIADSVLTNGRKSINAQAQGYNINVAIEVADYAIGTVEEFETWAKAYLQELDCTGKRAILTADIDYKGANFTEKVGGSVSFKYGELDGRGYSISNLTANTNAGAFYNWDNSTIKNLACVNWNVSSTSGIFVWRANNGLLENIYVSGNWTCLDTSATRGGAISSYAYGTTIRNFVADVEIVAGATAGVHDYAFVGNDGENATNLFVECTTSNGKNTLNSAGTLYTTAGALNANASAIVASFASPYWAVVDGAVKLVPLA